MGRGELQPSESVTCRDERTGAVVRQVTNPPSIHEWDALPDGAAVTRTGKRDEVMAR